MEAGWLEGDVGVKMSPNSIMMRPINKGQKKQQLRLISLRSNDILL